MTDHAPPKGTAIVTGATRGIGWAVALQLAQDGYDIAFCYRQQADRAAELAQAISGYGRRVLHQACDVAQLAEVQMFVKTCEEQLGNLTVLVNSAGIVRDSPLVMMKEQDWHAVVETNLNGTFHICRSVIFPLMKQKRGVIINLSSVAGIYGSPTQTNYAATKAGIIGFSRSLAKEVAPYNIRVNVVAPGFIATDMTAGINEKRRKKYLEAIPLGTFGQPQDVADTVAFLVSERARYITGQTIQVDGGISL